MKLIDVSVRKKWEIQHLIQHLILVYAYSSFSAVIGQIMVTWSPFKIDIGVQYHFPTSCHVLNSQLELLKRNLTEMNWYKELRRVLACKILIRKNTNCITFIRDKIHFQIKWINHYISKTNACEFFRYSCFLLRYYWTNKRIYYSLEIYNNLKMEKHFHNSLN